MPWILAILEQVKVLNVETREMVIDRVMELDEPALILEDLKWVILMVLFNAPGHESAYEQMEDLILSSLKKVGYILKRCDVMNNQKGG